MSVQICDEKLAEVAAKHFGQVEGQKAPPRKGGKETVASSPAALLDQFVGMLTAAKTEADLDTAFSLCLHFVPELDSKKQTEYLPRIVAAVSEKPQELSLFRMRLLSSLFNDDLLSSALPTSALGRFRPTVFSAVLRIALASNNASHISSFLAHLESWMAEWALSGQELSELLLLVVKLTKALDNGRDPRATEQHQQFVLRYLRSLDKAAPAALAAAKDIAAEAVTSALQAPGGDYDALMSLAAVRQLGNDKKTEKLFQLLRIFASEDVETYSKFAQENKQLLDLIGLAPEVALGRMRTLTLCTLGQQPQPLTFDTVMQKLGLPDIEAVEAAVIEAVASGRVEAKMEQDKGLVNIQRAAPRSFTGDAWQQLANRLQTWQRNVAHVLSALHEAQARARPAEHPETELDVDVEEDEQD